MGLGKMPSFLGKTLYVVGRIGFEPMTNGLKDQQHINATNLSI